MAASIEANVKRNGGVETLFQLFVIALMVGHPHGNGIGEWPVPNENDYNGNDYNGNGYNGNGIILKLGVESDVIKYILYILL